MDFRGIWMCSGKKCLKKGGKNKCAREGTTMGRTMATTQDDVTSHESAQQIMAPQKKGKPIVMLSIAFKKPNCFHAKAL